MARDDDELDADLQAALSASLRECAGSPPITYGASSSSSSAPPKTLGIGFGGSSSSRGAAPAAAASGEATWKERKDSLDDDADLQAALLASLSENSYGSQSAKFSKTWQEPSWQFASAASTSVGSTGSAASTSRGTVGSPAATSSHYTGSSFPSAGGGKFSSRFAGAGSASLSASAGSASSSAGAPNQNGRFGESDPVNSKDAVGPMRASAIQTFSKQADLAAVAAERRKEVAEKRGIGDVGRMRQMMERSERLAAGDTAMEPSRPLSSRDASSARPASSLANAGLRSFALSTPRQEPSPLGNSISISATTQAPRPGPLAGASISATTQVPRPSSSAGARGSEGKEPVGIATEGNITQFGFAPRPSSRPSSGRFSAPSNRHADAPRSQITSRPSASASFSGSAQQSFSSSGSPSMSMYGRTEAVNVVDRVKPTTSIAASGTTFSGQQQAVNHSLEAKVPSRTSKELISEVSSLRNAFVALDKTRSGWLADNALRNLFMRAGLANLDESLLNLLLLEIRGKSTTYTRDGMCSLDQAAYLYARQLGESECYLESRAHRHPVVRERLPVGSAASSECDVLEHEEMGGPPGKTYVCLMGCDFSICGPCLAMKVSDPFAAQQIMSRKPDNAQSASEVVPSRGPGKGDLEEDFDLQTALQLSLRESQP